MSSTGTCQQRSAAHLALSSRALDLSTTRSAVGWIDSQVRQACPVAYTAGWARWVALLGCAAANDSFGDLRRWHRSASTPALRRASRTSWRTTRPERGGRDRFL